MPQVQHSHAATDAKDAVPPQNIEKMDMRGNLIATSQQVVRAE